MSTRDLVQEALHSLEANKGRSLLTILGIVIGIASVIAMTSLIGGIQNSLVNSLGLNAARMVQIYSSQELTDSDVEKLRKMVPQIEQIGIVDSAYSEYKVGDKSYTVMAQGVDSDMLDAVGASKIVAGRTYSDIESKSGARVALIGRGGADQLYGNEQDAIGKTIKVSNGDVQIIGVIDGGNDSMGSLSLYMPRETIAELYGDDNPSFPSVTALAAEGTDMDKLCKTIESKVRSMKGISEDDEYESVSASSMKSAIDALNSFMGAFSLIMGAVAGISLLVGGIGIMNMMLTNVTERIREIGLRRALGATRTDITTQFLAESIAISLTGGVIGIIAGYAGSWALAWIVSSTGLVAEIGGSGGTMLVPAVSLSAVGFATGVCVFIGLVFGYYPARRAARLDPVEALRYQ